MVDVKDEDLEAAFGEEFGEGKKGAFKRPLRPLDDGAIEVAVLPQMGALAGDPEGWNKFHSLHWGFSVRQKRDPSKTVKIRFHCIREMGRNKMIVRDCPMCAKIDRQREEADIIEARYKLEKRSDEEIKTLMAPLTSWFRTFNSDRKMYLYAMLPNRTFNRLLISWRTFQDLDLEMRNIHRDLGINPRSPKTLVFWKITRIGTAKSVGKMTEKVEAATEYVTDGKTGKTSKNIKVTEMTRDEKLQALKEYVSLDDADAYKLTEAQIQALTDCDEDPETVERILGIAGAPAAVARPTPSSVQPETKAAARPPQNEAKSEPIAAVSAEDDEEEALLKAQAEMAARLAAARARKAVEAEAKRIAATTKDQAALVSLEASVTGSVGKALAEASPPPKPASVPVSFNDMTEDQLLAHLQIDPAQLGLK